MDADTRAVERSSEMVGIKYTGMCIGCVRAELELEHWTSLRGEEWTITCKNHRACEDVEERTIERLMKAGKTDFERKLP